jgi:nucleotide-binding universal stress UspA family protein
MQTQNTAANDAVGEIEKEFTSRGIKVKGKVLKGHPVEQICAYAEKEKCDLIIMGKKKKSKVEDFFAGSVSTQVANRAKTNVLIIK